MMDELDCTALGSWTWDFDVVHVPKTHPIVIISKPDDRRQPYNLFDEGVRNIAWDILRAHAGARRRLARETAPIHTLPLLPPSIIGTHARAEQSPGFFMTHGV
jgi:hypothetical protein